jgi:hypothetical protein
MTEIEAVTLKAEIVDENATRTIAKAVNGRRSAARKYVIRLRRQHPDATPAEVIRLLERHYATSISAAGAVIAAGSIAADIAISLMVDAGAAAAELKGSNQSAAKKPGKEAAKAAARIGAKVAAQQVAALIPVGDARVQFELTAIFGLAIADIHGMDLDQDQSQALVYGLSNGRVSQQQIALMAADLAKASPEWATSVTPRNESDNADMSRWASTLADALPAGAAQSLVRTIQTGQLDTTRVTLNGKQRTAIEYGVGALAGGVTRFVFGRDVIRAARAAFAEPPQSFPLHLDLPTKAEASGSKSKRALVALEGTAKATGKKLGDSASAAGHGVANGALAVGASVASASETVTRPFRTSVDQNGDAREPKALTAAKNVGGAVAGAGGAVGASVAKKLRRKKRE